MVVVLDASLVVLFGSWFDGSLLVGLRLNRGRASLRGGDGGDEAAS